MTELFNQALLALKQSLTISLEHVFLFGSLIAGLAFLIILLLQEIPLKGREYESRTENEFSFKGSKDMAFNTK